MVDSRNIVDDQVPPTENYLLAIFTRQQELMNKYREIEKMPDVFDLNTYVGQSWVKDFCWRVTEELAEASEHYQKILHICKFPMEHGESEMEISRQLFFEELSDALHFLVELSLIVGVDYQGFSDLTANSDLQTIMDCWDGGNDADMVVTDPSIIVHSHMWDIVYELGLLGNCLKNKRWKQSPVLTDMSNLNKHLIRTFMALFGLLGFLKLDAKEVYVLYYKKSVVNKFRQDSGY
jgi:hypothetical protein